MSFYRLKLGLILILFDLRIRSLRCICTIAVRCQPDYENESLEIKQGYLSNMLLGCSSFTLYIGGRLQ